MCGRLNFIVLYGWYIEFNKVWKECIVIDNCSSINVMMYRTKDINQKETKIQKKKVFELIKKKSKKIISKNNECDIEYVI